MQMSDVIADMLTRIRNANDAKHATVDIPASNMKKAIAEILVNEGYVMFPLSRPSKTASRVSSVSPLSTPARSRRFSAVSAEFPSPVFVFTQAVKRCPV